MRAEYLTTQQNKIISEAEMDLVSYSHATDIKSGFDKVDLVKWFK